MKFHVEIHHRTVTKEPLSYSAAMTELMKQLSRGQEGRLVKVVK